VSPRPPPPASPLTLAIEVSNPSAHADHTRASTHPDSSTPDILGPSVALARGSSVLDQEPLITRDRHDDDLMPAIDRLVRRAGFTPRDLERIAVSIGPGGFTGLRVAIATAKALGEAIIARGGNPDSCTPVPSARVVAHNHAAAGPHRPFAVALASKRHTAWLTVFAPDTTPLPPMGTSLDTPGLLASADDLEAICRARAIGTLLADEHLPAALRDRAAQLGIVIHPPIFSAAACARVAATLSPINPAALLPLYPREPEAVTKWRTLHPRSDTQP